MVAQTPWLLWIVLTVASVAVGAAMLWGAFASFNRREQQQQGFEVKQNAAGHEPAAPREKDTDHG